jgi:hypothetical protein
MIMGSATKNSLRSPLSVKPLIWKKRKKSEVVVIVVNLPTIGK